MVSAEIPWNCLDRKYQLAGPGLHAVCARQ